MRRVVPKKVQPIADPLPALDEALTEPSRPGAPVVKRRTRTSVAMLSLALSMGASGLLLPRHDDRAIAAEPQATESEEAAPALPVDRLSSNSGRGRQSDLGSEVLRGDVPVYANGFEAPSGASFVPEKPSVPSALEDSRTRRDAALDRMRNQRQRLRQSLTQVREFQDPEVYQGAQAGTDVPKAIAPNTLSDGAMPGFVGGTTTYQVRQGDTLSSLADAYGVSEDVLVRLNDLTDPHFLQVNQVLVVPRFARQNEFAELEPSIATADAALQPAAHRPTPDASSSQETGTAGVAESDVIHHVNAGETLSAIARSYGVSANSLVAANQLDNPDLIRAGEILSIPGQTISSPSVVAAAEPQTKAVSEEPAAFPEVPVAIELSEDLPTTETTVATVLFSTDFISPEQAATEQPDSEALPVDAAASSVSPEQLTKSNVHASQLLNEFSELSVNSSSERAEAIAEPDQPITVAALYPSAPPNDEVPSFGGLSPDELELRERERKVNEVADGLVDAEPQVAAVPTADAPDAPQIPAEQPQVVAAAPLGSENYAPLVEPVAGRMVSPELPPLPAAEAFLPEGSAIFDGYMWPARGVLTSGFGPRWGRMHRGIDIAAPVGTPIYAAAPGVVEFAGWNSGGYGYMVDIRHPDGSMTRYAHNSRLLVARGQSVDQGEQIADMGSTGYSTGPHLHFEVHLPNRGAVNPMSMLASR